MSKLKRKKSSIEESRCERQSRNKKSNDSLSEVQDSSCSTTSNVTGRTRWWESSDLSDAERLWALTLRAFCPSLQSDQEERIPQLPPPSSTKTLVQVSDWRWCSADEDVNPPPDLPAPSFLATPPQVNGFSAPPQPPAEENTGESVPPAITDQENHASSPDQESDEQTVQPHHLEVNCIELSKEQSDSATQEVKRRSGAGLDVESGAGNGAKTGAGGSGSWLRMISEAEGSVSGMGTKQGAGGSGAGQKVKSGASQRAKSGERGLDAESGLGKGVKTGSRLRTISEAVSSMGTKQGAGGSGSGQRAKSGLVGFGENPGTSGSGLGQGTKSGSEFGTKSVADGSGATSRSRMECCPMCLMPFPAGYMFWNTRDWKTEISFGTRDV
ncbi:Trophinin [Labeo rohita]|uniref:Trophinin n=1 Tax=Labeo rohita TaxID=84645 RepID=A0ABQ8MFY4_LABRO|nr:Trophinin [Labeo rohita]